MTTPWMTAEEMIEMLRQACKDAGGQRAWASAHGLTVQWVNQVLHRKKLPGGVLPVALGLEPVVMYRRRS